MKHLKFLAIASFVAIVASIVSCQGATENAQNTVTDSTSTDTAAAVVNDSVVADTYLAAIEKYLVDSIGINYDKTDVSIPSYTMVAVDESNPSDILAWGCYWIENFNIAGDTLKMKSGGSYPGLMHVSNSDGRFCVTSFECVADGSDFLPSAKRIFAEKYDKFAKLNSDDVARDETRMKAIKEFVAKHNLKVTLVYDYGWPVKPIK